MVDFRKLPTNRSSTPTRPNASSPSLIADDIASFYGLQTPPMPNSTPPSSRSITTRPRRRLSRWALWATRPIAGERIGSLADDSVAAAFEDRRLVRYRRIRKQTLRISSFLTGIALSDTVRRPNCRRVNGGAPALYGMVRHHSATLREGARKLSLSFPFTATIFPGTYASSRRSASVLQKACLSPTAGIKPKQRHFRKTRRHEYRTQTPGIRSRPGSA